MHSDIQYILKEFAKEFDKQLEKNLPDGVPQELFSAIKYSLLSGGKRIRPFLFLESAKVAGYKNPQDLMDIAIAIEMIHTYSLIHDDLPAMDDDDYRRGKPTCHKVYGEAIAILAGDGLLTYAFKKMAQIKTISPEKLLKVISLIADKTGLGGMVAGQAADILAEEGKFTDIKFIHQNKTTKFIEACCEAGAIAADRPDLVEKFKTYGYNVGMAFQIWDDILDEIGDEKKLGKKTGKDREKNKLTYVSVYGLEKAIQIAKEHIKTGIEAIKDLENNENLINLAKFIVSREV